VSPSMADAVETAIAMAEDVGEPGESISGAGVVVTGSVVTAGEVRTLLGRVPE